MSVEKFVITKESSNFTVLPNKVLQNLKNPDALGLWCYLASLPPLFQFYKDSLRKHFTIGREKLDKLLAILKDSNLIKIQVVRGECGKFLNWELQVLNGDLFSSNFDEIQENINDNNNLIQNTGFQYSGSISPEYGLPVTGFSTPINTININTIQNQKLFCSSRDERDSLFETFYSSYPRHQGRTQAMKAWKKLKCEPIGEKIIEHVKARIAGEWAGKEKQFIPLPASFLNSKRWEDELEEGSTHAENQRISQLNNRQASLRHGWDVINKWESSETLPQLAP